MDWAPQGIRVNSVAPWFIRTPLTEPILHGPLLEQVLERTPMQRTGEPEEVSAAVLFLASSAASYISGQVLLIDGALMCNGFLFRPTAARGVVDAGVTGGTSSTAGAGATVVGKGACSNTAAATAPGHERVTSRL